jgi:hypothetical protein
MQFDSIAAEWRYGDNLAALNRETAGMDPADLTGLEAAVSNRWTVIRAAEIGYKTVQIQGFKGVPGAFTHFEVDFLKPIGTEPNGITHHPLPGEITARTLSQTIGTDVFSAVNSLAVPKTSWSPLSPLRKLTDAARRGQFKRVMGTILSDG